MQIIWQPFWCGKVNVDIWQFHGFSCHSTEPPEEARKQQPWPTVFPFPSMWMWMCSNGAVWKILSTLLKEYRWCTEHFSGGITKIMRQWQTFKTVSDWQDNIYFVYIFNWLYCIKVQMVSWKQSIFTELAHRSDSV